jgi:hypothetical protein
LSAAFFTAAHRLQGDITSISHFGMFGKTRPFARIPSQSAIFGLRVVVSKRLRRHVANQSSVDRRCGTRNVRVTVNLT